MKKSIVWVAVAVVSFAALCLFVGMGVKNTAISYEESIENAKRDIGNAEKRRFELIPKLVECVKQYDEHEYKTLHDIVEARTAGDTTVTLDHMSNVIKAVVEAYPDLKSQQNYNELMNELSSTENGIVNLRNNYNKEVTKYKRYVRVFPSKQILSLLGYEEYKCERLEFDDSLDDFSKSIFN